MSLATVKVKGTTAAVYLVSNSRLTQLRCLVFFLFYVMPSGKEVESKILNLFVTFSQVKGKGAEVMK